MNEAILIIEDEATIRVTIGGFLSRLGYRVAQAEDAAGGVALAMGERFDLILLDLRLPDGDGLDVLARLRERGTDALIVIMTAYPELNTALGAMRAGAYDYIQKPFDLDDLREVVARALETRSLRREVAWRRAKDDATTFDDMLGDSPAFLGLLTVTQKIAEAGRVPVLIRGESGTGKERIAQAIHFRSARAAGPWITLNCSALPEGLLESELFGHEKGAFTDARQSKKGLMELADGGTLFLDEIGDLSPALQPKLLRVLETQRFRRLGGVREIEVDVRFVAATNRDLAELVRTGEFREDLYYRLNVGAIEMPPLRDRREDIVPLAQHFLERAAPEVGVPAPHLTDEIAALLEAYPWPGNIRELRNVMERAAILSGGGDLTPHQLPREIANGHARAAARTENEPAAHFLPKPLAEIEYEHIVRVLDHCGGNKTQAAEMLGVTRLTLRNKLKQHALEEGDCESDAR